MASRVLLDVSEWLQVDLMRKGVEPWGSQKIQQIGVEDTLVNRNLLYGWCDVYKEAVKCGKPHLNLHVLQIVVTVPPLSASNGHLF